MNPKKQDPFDLTSYLLGEATPAQAAKVKKEAESNPETQAELERTMDMIQALQNAPAFPRRSLHPRQRDTVLAMSRKVTPIVSPHRSQQKPPGVFWQLSKYAAAACLTGGAFILGQHLRTAPENGTRPAHLESNLITHTGHEGENDGSITLDDTSMPSVSVPVDGPMFSNFEAVAENAMKPDLLPNIPAILDIPDRPPVVSPQPADVVLVDREKSSESRIQRQPETPPAYNSTVGFEIVSRKPDAQITLNPNLLRPKPTSSQMIFSAPLPQNKSAPLTTKQRKEQQPSLMIRSWKAEIASCPWNSGRRLVRLVAQVPADQPAINANEENYQLLAKFDPRFVQAYRLVAEKHLPAANGAGQGTQFAWFEIIPTKSFAASSEKPVTLGSIDVIQPRGSRTSSPLELKIVDRGTHWEDAREDFIFETAMVGFGLLLEGTGNTGNLNHDMVLEIAEKTRGTNDPKGERSQFIEVIRQAQMAAGLGNN